MSAQASSSKENELGEKAKKLYASIREKVETPGNIGNFIVMDVDSGDFEIDKEGIESSRLLQSRHPGAKLYALRIGYKTAVSFSGGLERTSP